MPGSAFLLLAGGSLMRRSVLRIQVNNRIHQRHVRERLRKISDNIPLRVILLGKQADIHPQI